MLVNSFSFLLSVVGEKAGVRQWVGEVAHGQIIIDITFFK